MAQSNASEKVTFSLPADLVRQLRNVVALGISPSQTALVREAVEKELRRLEDESIDRQYRAAAKDPGFLRDTDDTMKAFASADAETARMIP